MSHLEGQPLLDGGTCFHVDNQRCSVYLSPDGYIVCIGVSSPLKNTPLFLPSPHLPLVGGSILISAEGGCTLWLIRGNMVFSIFAKLKTCKYAKYELCQGYFSRNFLRSFRTAFSKNTVGQNLQSTF